MDINEAYKLMGLNQSASDDDLKKAHRSFAKQYHPDVYKDDNTKLRDINEAYQLIRDFRDHPEKHQSPFASGFGGFPGGIGINLSDLFNNINGGDQQKQINLPPIILTVNISFNESVLGVSKEIKYNRCIKCETCNGVGSLSIGNGCSSCDGKGRITKQSGNTIFTSSCSKCQGKNVKKQECSSCNGKAVKDNEISGSIQIPPGTKDQESLRLQGAGHYAGGSMFGDSYGNVIVNVSVKPEENMNLVGTDVVSTLKISMNDAVFGCKRDIKTVFGMKEIVVPPMSRNNEEIEIDKCGVANTNGTHRVILDVPYSDAIVEFLKGDK